MISDPKDKKIFYALSAFAILLGVALTAVNKNMLFLVLVAAGITGIVFTSRIG